MTEMLLYGTNGRPLQRSERASSNDFFNFNGQSYQLGLNTTISGNKEEMDGSFASFANSGFKSNGIVFSCMLARLSLFSQVRFMFQQIRSGIEGDLFSTPALSALNENPGGPGQTLGDLLARAIQDVDLAGNSFHVKRPGRIKRLRPDWVSIVMGSEDDPQADANDVDAEVIGYIYKPGGWGNTSKPQVFLPEEVCHFAPIPDPLAHFRGMSWLTPVIREVQGDIAASDFKTLYYSNGATPNLVISFDATIKREAFDAFVKAFDEKHVGIANAYKTLYLGAGMTVDRIGSNFQEGDFKGVTGATETRIVMASGLHPTIVGTADSLQGSSLNPGNFTAAARLTADKTFRFLWGNFAGSMQTIVPAPDSSSRLWYDAEHVDFLKDDEKDRANVLGVNATTVGSLITQGWTPESANDAVLSGDFRRLKHTGMYSVQLQPPGAKEPAPADPVVSVPPQKLLPATTQKASADVAVSTEARCSNPGCNKKFLDVTTPPWSATCSRCKTVTSVGLAPDVSIARAGPDPSALLLAWMTREQPAAPGVTFAEGAFQVTVEAAPAPAAPNVTFAEGAIVVRNEIPVQPPAQVTIAEGAVQVRVEAAPAPNVTVEAAQIHVEMPEASSERVELEYDDAGKLRSVTSA